MSFKHLFNHTCIENNVSNDESSQSMQRTRIDWKHIDSDVFKSKIDGVLKSVVVRKFIQCV
jgi:hypothetical protein